MYRLSMVLNLGSFGADRIFTKRLLWELLGLYRNNVIVAAIVTVRRSAVKRLATFTLCLLPNAIISLLILLFNSSEPVLLVLAKGYNR